METFLTNSSADETDIDVKNVTFAELSKPPYKAAVDFDKRLYTAGTRQGTQARNLRRPHRPSSCAMPCRTRSCA